MEGIYILFGTGILVALIFGAIIIHQDWKEKHRPQKP